MLAHAHGHGRTTRDWGAGAEPRHRRRAGRAARPQAEGAARSRGDARPQDRLPRRGRHSPSCSPRKAIACAGRRLPCPMSLRPTPPPADLVASDAARAGRGCRQWGCHRRLLPDAADIAYLLYENAVAMANCARGSTPAHRALDPEVRIDWRVQDGDRVPAGTVLATLSGRTRAGHRRTCRTELPADAVRHGHHHGRVRGRRAGHRRTIWTPARPCPACARRRSTPSAAAAGRTPAASACTTP